MERRKDEAEQTPERLQRIQEQAEKKKQLKKIRETKNEEIKQKLLDALRTEEEARMEHEEELEEQVPEGGAIERTEPATEPHEEAPAAPAAAPTPAPAPEEQEIADITELTDQEEKKIEELHEEGKPHIHKNLPYPVEGEESEESVTDMLSNLWRRVKDPETRRTMWEKVKKLFKGKASSKYASADEPGLLWRAPEDNESHDYQPLWDYEPVEGRDLELAKLAVQAANGIYRNTKEPFELWDVDLSELGAVATYINGTCGYPVILVDLEAHRGYEDQIGKSIDHELKHAIQESEGREYDEGEAEED